MKKKFLLTDLFDTYAQFCHCAPGADTSSDFDSLQGSAVAARKRIVTIIGEEVFALIVTMDNEDVVKSFLQTAMANLTLATQIAFDAVNRRKNEVNVYKYEMEGMTWALIDRKSDAKDTSVEVGGRRMIEKTKKR